MKAKNFRKRGTVYEGEDDQGIQTHGSDDEGERRLVLEEVKFLQKQREKKSGIPAIPTTAAAAQGAVVASFSGGLVPNKASEKNEGDGEKDELVLQDTFAQETAVMVEDPNMLRYVEQELAKKRGRNISANHAENEIKHAEDELYNIPEHLKVKRRNSEESSTQWTTGIAEIQLPIENNRVGCGKNEYCCLFFEKLLPCWEERVVLFFWQVTRLLCLPLHGVYFEVCNDCRYKLRNIEETEAAKKLLQEKRLTGRIKTDSSIPSSYSADYFQRGRDYAEKLRREHPELYKERGAESSSQEPKPNESGTDAAGRRQAATDEFMLERFRKRERHRVMRR
ncbi:hypothetical protein RHMOL_Rhmol13G0000900 [Rhododendron molle]|uniref:Uncharacterized protein n=1 Tax=Rhododendron molle TaxID=49168 RepID=A0ACC0L1C8_RHOML|nr:hypothetical protein RHMOL_Rhmol13G0000900 [Rhododendron molle]